VGQNNTMIAAELKRSEQYIDKVRLEHARQANGKQLAGPVRL
jgi:hypothetical protein